MVVPYPPLNNDEVRLPAGYEPHPFDVITRKGRDSVSHAGNNRFRLCVEMRVDRYVKATVQFEKTSIIQEIIETVHASGGRFIRQHDTSDEVKYSCNLQLNNEIMYYEIGNKKATDKAGHAMRLALSKREDLRSGRWKSWSAEIPTRKKWRAPSNASKSHWSKTAKRQNTQRNDATEAVSFHNDEVREGLNQITPAMMCDPLFARKDRSTMTDINGRQSWHAGSGREEKNSNASLTRRQAALLTPTDSSLSSEGWDLNCLQNKQELNNEDDDLSFGSLPPGEFSDRIDCAGARPTMEWIVAYNERNEDLPFTPL